MNLYHERGKMYAVAMQLDFMSFGFGVLFPWFGFEIFYMRRNPVACEVQSGYRVYSEGARHLKPGVQLAVYEQFVVSHD